MAMNLNTDSRPVKTRTVVYVSVMLVFLSPATCAEDATFNGLPDDQAGRCRYGAEHMIDVARQSLLDPGSRSERVEKRRRLVESWESDLNAGDDPCEVYMDIQKSATTF